MFCPICGKDYTRHSDKQLKECHSKMFSQLPPAIFGVGKIGTPFGGFIMKCENPDCPICKNLPGGSVRMPLPDVSEFIKKFKELLDPKRLENVVKDTMNTIPDVVKKTGDVLMRLLQLSTAFLTKLGVLAEFIDSIEEQEVQLWYKTLLVEMEAMPK